MPRRARTFNYFDRFAHFASHQLDPADVLELDLNIFGWIFRNNSMVGHVEFARYLDLDLIHDIRNVLLKSGCLPVGKLISLLAPRHPHEENVRAHLLWLMKYGIARLRR